VLTVALTLKVSDFATGYADCGGRVRSRGWPGRTRSAPGGAADRDGLRSRRGDRHSHTTAASGFLLHPGACVRGAYLSARMRSLCCASKERLGADERSEAMLSGTGRFKPSRRDLRGWPGGAGEPRRAPYFGNGHFRISGFRSGVPRKWRTPKHSGPLMHLKAYAIEGELLRTGSANFSASGVVEISTWLCQLLPWLRDGSHMTAAIEGEFGNPQRSSSGIGAPAMGPPRS
jgi:hypothetical protein